MQPGDLRRFKPGAPDLAACLRGGVFVVLARYLYPLDNYLSFEKVDFLVADGIKTGWNSSWVKSNSEVLDGVE